jgi:hypothetical protein
MQVGLSGRRSDQALTAQAHRLVLVNLRVSLFFKKMELLGIIFTWFHGFSLNLVSLDTFS